MKQTILAARRQEAHDRLVAAAEAVASALDLALPELSPLERDPVVARLRRDEVLALFLGEVAEAVAGVQMAALEQGEGYLSQSDILAIPGLTKTSKEAITDYFEALRAGSD